jgi:hypothetical protein
VDSETRKGVLHFRISGEFITRHSRRLWVEGSPLAMKTLTTGLQGMTEALALEILTGRKKLVGWNSRVRLRNDNAVTDDRGIKLPRSLHEVLSKVDQELQAERKRSAELAQRAGLMADRIERTILGSRFGVGPLIDSLKNEFCPEPPPQEPEQKVPPPLPEKDWSHNWTCGWLTPEGDFYGCEYSGHQALCEKLGLDSYQIERRGWIKYQRREWIGYFGKDPITQKQIDALWDWSRATKKKYPYWIAGGTDADEAR